MFEWFYITSQGKALLAKAQVGSALNFTKAQMGRGLLPGGQNIERMTELVTVVKDLPIAGAKAADDIVTVSVQISNRDLDHAIWFREIGLFARDPDQGEILYAYGNAGERADYVPAPTESIVDYRLALNCAIGNAQQISFEERPSLVFVTREDVIALSNGGTGATNAQAARANLNAAEIDHTHTTASITGGMFSADRLPVVPVNKGGTGRTDGKAGSLAVPRTIGLSGGATGTPTGFDGSGNITIPVTELNADQVTAGTLAVERGGTGRNDGRAAALAAPRGFSITGGATAAAAQFDGTGDVTLNVTGLNMSAASAGTLPISRGGTGAATAINARKALKIQCGYINQTIASLAAGGQVTYQVTFPTEFSSVPIVLVAGQSTSSGRMNGLVANVGSRTTTGFEIDIYNATAGSSGAYAKGVYWLAVEDA